MPRYFMRDTPLQALEQLMMSQPGQKPRGGGIYRSPFHYTPKDVACEYCQNYVRKHPCRLCECTCLDERIEAGVLELNEFVRDCFAPSMEKLGAVVTLAEPKSAAQIKNLAENLDLFDFAPGTHTPEEYGKYMIRQSGHFDYDENLDAFYDYEKYGTERMNAEDGMFTDRGYIAYKGYTSMEEVMNGSQSSHMEMGGFSR